MKLIIIICLWARAHCRIRPSHFLASVMIRLIQSSFVLLYFELYLVSVFSCTVLFVSISQMIGCEDHLQKDVDCVGWCVKLIYWLMLINQLLLIYCCICCPVLTYSNTCISIQAVGFVCWNYSLCV